MGVAESIPAVASFKGTHVGVGVQIKGIHGLIEGIVRGPKQGHGVVVASSDNQGYVALLKPGEHRGIDHLVDFVHRCCLAQVENSAPSEQVVGHPFVDGNIQQGGQDALGGFSGSGASAVGTNS